MTYFYQFMVWSTSLELALAYHGGNRRNIAHLSERLSYWQGQRDKHEIRRMA